MYSRNGELTHDSKHVHDDHIHLLHKYNDIKDVAQTLIGKLSEIEGISVKEMHNRFDLDMED